LAVFKFHLRELYVTGGLARVAVMSEVIVGGKAMTAGGLSSLKYLGWWRTKHTDALELTHMIDKLEWHSVITEASTLELGKLTHLDTLIKKLGYTWNVPSFTKTAKIVDFIAEGEVSGLLDVDSKSMFDGPINVIGAGDKVPVSFGYYDVGPVFEIPSPPKETKSAFSKIIDGLKKAKLFATLYGAKTVPISKVKSWKDLPASMIEYVFDKHGFNLTESELTYDAFSELLVAVDPKSGDLLTYTQEFINDFAKKDAALPWKKVYELGKLTAGNGTKKDLGSLDPGSHIGPPTVLGKGTVQAPIQGAVEIASLPANGEHGPEFVLPKATLKELPFGGFPGIAFKEDKALPPHVITMHYPGKPSTVMKVMPDGSLKEVKGAKSDPSDQALK
jgi:hypothetical protein